jgi:hypothetical protein
MKAAKALGENIPRPIPKEWFQDIAPSLFKKGVTGNALKNAYDSLVIDEAQVFHEDWLYDLVTWFPRQRILACCDETQVFPYEHLTPTNRIVEVLQAGEAFTLTINLRSPKSVFERVQDVFPLSYEQDSRRPPEEDTLEEVAVFDPLKTVYRTLRRLHDEGIDPRHIIVVYLDSEPMFPSDFDKMLNQGLEDADSRFRGTPDYQQAVKRIRQQTSTYQWYHLQRDIEGFFARKISIGKFRGLESPVVIVYANGKHDPASLACAYTRATTKCIVIYNIISFFRDEDLNILQRVVVRDVQAIRAEVTARWPLEKVMSLTPIISASATVYWSSTWQGWIFWKQELKDEVAANLWCYHL